MPFTVAPLSNFCSGFFFNERGTVTDGRERERIFFKQ